VFLLALVHGAAHRLLLTCLEYINRSSSAPAETCLAVHPDGMGAPQGSRLVVRNSVSIVPSVAGEVLTCHSSADQRLILLRCMSSVIGRFRTYSMSELIL